MEADPDLRAVAAHALLDALDAADVVAGGSERGDQAMLTALEPIGVDSGDPQQLATISVAVELLHLLVLREAALSGVEYEQVVADLRGSLSTMGY